MYKTTQANHGSEFKWLGLEPNDHGPSEIGTCSVFEPPLYNVVNLSPRFFFNFSGLDETWLHSRSLP